MSSIDLRNAAAVLRELAEGATSGPWVSVAGASEQAFWVEVQNRATIAEGSAGSMTYIAAMSPPVALALADWLDAEAAECDQMVTRRHERDGVPVRDVEREVFAGHPALAVASAILKARA